MNDKFNELYFGVITILAGSFGWIVKNIRRDAINAHKRINDLERRIVSPEQLENTLKPIRADLQTILQHLLQKK